MILNEGITWGKVVSLLTFVSYFTVLPYVFKPVFAAVEGYNWFLVYVSTVLVFSLTTQVLFHLAMYFVYRSKHPWVEQYRIHNKPWPWEANPEEWPKTLKKTLLSVLMNQLFYSAVLVFGTDLLLFHVPYKTSVEEWPTTLTMLSQFTVIIFVEDFFSYHVHRLLHSQSFYWIHKQHHEYYTTISLTTTYAHPLEIMFSNTMPLYLGYRVLSLFTEVHVITIGIWFMFRFLQTCEVHSGYNWTWAQMSFFPWKNLPQHHDFHHSMNVGTFGSMFNFWDTLMGTHEEYNKYLKSKRSQ